MIKSTLGALLGFIYDFVGSYGLSIILFTIVVKVILYPLYKAQIKSQKNMQIIQPKLEELKAKYSNDKEKLNQKTLELYSEYKINPLAGCLPLLIQLPIIFALFDVLRNPVTRVFGGDQALADAATNVPFLWITDLTKPDLMSNILNVDFAGSLPGLLPIIAAILTYVQFKTMNTSNSSTQNNQMQMFGMMMPFMILFFGISMSAGVVLYWVVSTSFQIVQQMGTASGKNAKPKGAK